MFNPTYTRCVISCFHPLYYRFSALAVYTSIALTLDSNDFSTLHFTLDINLWRDTSTFSTTSFAMLLGFAGFGVFFAPDVKFGTLPHL